MIVVTRYYSTWFVFYIGKSTLELVIYKCLSHLNVINMNYISRSQRWNQEGLSGRVSGMWGRRWARLFMDGKGKFFLQCSSSCLLSNAHIYFMLHRKLLLEKRGLRRYFYWVLCAHNIARIIVKKFEEWKNGWILIFLFILFAWTTLLFFQSLPFH